jgi:hypothetical protein
MIDKNEKIGRISRSDIGLFDLLQAKLLTVNQKLTMIYQCRLVNTI